MECSGCSGGAAPQGFPRLDCVGNYGWDNPAQLCSSSGSIWGDAGRKCPKFNEGNAGAAPGEEQPAQAWSDLLEQLWEEIPGDTEVFLSQDQ